MNPQYPHTPGVPDQPAPPQPPIPAPAWQPPSQLPPQSYAPIASEPVATLPEPHIPQTPLAPYDPGRGKKRALVLIVSLLVILGLGALTYFLFKDEGSKATSPRQATQSDQAQSAPIPLSDLQALTFIPPSDLSRYTARDDNTAMTMTYTAKEGGCSLQFGVSTAEELPGQDFEEIVSKQLQEFRETGELTTGPVSTDQLVLHDATNGKRYTMPTQKMSAKIGPKPIYVIAYYSAAILKDGSRAFVTRLCQSETAAVPDSAAAPINQDAAAITVVRSP